MDDYQYTGPRIPRTQENLDYVTCRADLLIKQASERRYQPDHPGVGLHVAGGIQSILQPHKGPGRSRSDG